MVRIRTTASGRNSTAAASALGEQWQDITPHRVLVVERECLLADALAMVLEADGYEVTLVADHHPEAIVALLVDACPAVVLLDLGPVERLPAAVEVITSLHNLGLRLVIVVDAAPVFARAAYFEAGADAVASRSESLATLLGQVARATLGGPPTGVDECRIRQQADECREAYSSGLLALAPLTRREQEVLAGLVRGRRAKELADEAVVSVATVRSQIQSILRKLGVSSQVAAVAAAARAGWTHGPSRN